MLGVMYSPAQLLRGISNHRAGLRELNKLYWSRGRRRAFNAGGTDFIEEDWDNLLILDGCRHDALAEQLDDYDLGGSLQSRISPGSSTREFLAGCLDGKQLDDVVYVTASTMLYQESVFRERIDVELHDVVDVWEEGIEYGEDGVMPETVARRAREAHERYPNKRLVVHFVQPHAPYLGERGRELFPEFAPNPLSERFRGVRDTDDNTLWTVYRENLDLVLEEVDDLLPELTGRTVVTADHGMLIGERERPIPVRSYGHPGSIYVEELVRVPWLVVDDGRRKEVFGGSVADNYARKRDDELDERAREHLAQMGYL